ncbi:hypothetical protein [Tetzosporium hominis]|nr:hypothetical protein [Tetzosporium hominis]
MKPSMKNSSFIEATKKKWFYPVLYGAQPLSHYPKTTSRLKYALL